MLNPGALPIGAGPEAPPERSEVLEWMDRLDGQPIRSLRHERRKLEKAGVLRGVHGSDWFRLYAINALIRSHDIHQDLSEMEQRARKRSRKAR